MPNFFKAFFMMILLVQCGPKTTTVSHTESEGNHLKNETSPYLLQHANNPVDWHPWGPEALQKAKDQNKLILVSVGYAACHWCHVMEHESFEDTAVAKIMNEHFVNIKVDREERPDIDDVYMAACQMTNGRGCGWPLNSFALADGRPVWAGTYFPKNDWVKILTYFIDMKEKEPEKLEEYAQQLTSGIQSIDRIEPVTSKSDLTLEDLKKITTEFTNKMDKVNGGKEGAPKFPFPNGLQYLLKADFAKAGIDAQSVAFLSLDKMAAGGIYDHLGGGFARYSTDDKWLVPHFEKMLYDNAQLLSTYAEAYRIDPKPRYKEVVYETVAFLNRELSHENGGFYSSLDADSEGEEGKFYVWTKEEIEATLKEDAEFFNDYYNVSGKGNWEDEKNILHVQKTLVKVAKKHNISVETATKIIDSSKAILLKKRAEKVRPGTDDKILASWNGLTLRALVDAYKTFGDQQFLDRAMTNAKFLKNQFIKDDFRVDRNYKNGKSNINGFLDDYSFLIDGFIGLYEVTFDESWLQLADNLSAYALEHFLDEESGMFFFTSDIDPALIARKKEIADNVIPGSNSAMARNLARIGHYLYKEEYLERAQSMLSNMEKTIKGGQPLFYSNWCNLYFEELFPPYEIAIIGDDHDALRKSFQQKYLPNAIFLGGSSEGDMILLKDKLQEGSTMIYVCQNKVCKFPVDNVEAALNLMN